MLTGKPETNDINVQIHNHRMTSLKDAAARTVLLLAITWFANLTFSVWMGGLWVNPLSANLFTLGVTILAALCLYVPLWRSYRGILKHLNDTKRRLEITVTAPPPR
jgi:hypothetical protein